MCRARCSRFDEAGGLIVVPPPSLATGEGGPCEAWWSGAGPKRSDRHLPPPPPTAVPLPRFAGGENRPSTAFITSF